MPLLRSNAEIICVDDGSTDQTPVILAKIDVPGFRLIRTSNRGVSAARNLGLQEAKGRFAVFLDSDDIAKHRNLLALLSIAEREHLDLILFNLRAFVTDLRQAKRFYTTIRHFYRRQNSGKVLNGAAMFCFLRDSKSYFSSATAYLFDVDFLRGKNLLFPEGFIMEDHVFTAQAIISSRRALSVSTIGIRRRVRAGSITDEKTERHVAGLEKAARDILAIQTETGTNLPLNKELNEIAFQLRLAADVARNAPGRGRTCPLRSDREVE